MDAEKVKEMLTEEDIIDLMLELGSSYPRTSSKNNALLFNTICHGGDSHKLYYYIETKTFRCYTHCSCNYDVFSLIQKIKDVDFSVAYRYICNRFGIDGRYRRDENSTDDGKAHREMKKISERLKRKVEIQTLPEFNDDVLSIYSDIYPIEWIEDGISIKAMKKYGIKFQICHNRAIIPVYDINNRLVGIRCRNFDDIAVQEGFKYMPLKHFSKYYNFPTNQTLYGINIAKDRVGNGLGELFVFEAEKSCMQLETMYYDNLNRGSVALFGSNFSDEQILIIIKLLKPQIVYLCFDKEYHKYGDELYFKQKEKITKIEKKLSNNVNVATLWDKYGLLDFKDSPTDKGKEIFEKILKSANFAS